MFLSLRNNIRNDNLINTWQLFSIRDQNGKLLHETADIKLANQLEINI